MTLYMSQCIFNPHNYCLTGNFSCSVIKLLHALIIPFKTIFQLYTLK